MTAVSDQTRRNRSEAGRKAAAAKKRQLALYGPRGSVRGSAMLDPADSTIPAILARLKARATAQ